MDSEELQLELDVLQSMVSESDDDLVDDSVKHMLKFIEAIIMQGKLRGGCDKLFDSPRFRKLFEILKMKYLSGFCQMDPLTEITIITLKTYIEMYRMNSLLSADTSVDLNKEVNVDEIGKV